MAWRDKLKAGGPEPYMLVGFAALLLLFGGLGGWSLAAKLEGAVIASGQVVVESSAKAVQHLEGGIVKKILVKGGQEVQAGETLLYLDDTVSRANLQLLQTQVDEAQARRDRLATERLASDTTNEAASPTVVSFAADLTGRQQEQQVAEILAGEQRLYATRRKGLLSQVSVMRQRIAEQEKEIAGLQAEARSKHTQSRLIAQEAEGLETLYKKGFAPLTRLLALQREAARLQGELGRHQADIARVRASIGETEQSILQLGHDFSTEVEAELRQVTADLNRLLQERIAVRDRLSRLAVLAPRTGRVHAMQVYTEGGVVQAGETLMSIVPLEDRLVVDLQVSPADIELVSPGQSAQIQFSAFEQRSTPKIDGWVQRVSADALQDPQSGLTYFTVRLQVPDDTEELLGQLLKPGMPAEAFIKTPSRRAIEYFLKPLSDQIARTFREQ